MSPWGHVEKLASPRPEGGLCFSSARVCIVLSRGEEAQGPHPDIRTGQAARTPAESRSTGGGVHPLQAHRDRKALSSMCLWNLGRFPGTDSGRSSYCQRTPVSAKSPHFPCKRVTNPSHPQPRAGRRHPATVGRARNACHPAAVCPLTRWLRPAIASVRIRRGGPLHGVSCCWDRLDPRRRRRA